MSLLAGALPKVEINATDTCVCSHDKLLVLQQQLHTMWQSGVAACIALAALLAVGESTPFLAALASDVWLTHLPCVWQRSIVGASQLMIVYLLEVLPDCHGLAVIEIVL